ncbi:MAG: HlyD family efflux transporter periplasmic adaptor subunit [Limnohabitans sp.]
MSFKKRAAAAAGLALVLLFPVDMTVLAQGELVPLEPSIIASPLDGVVQKVLVLPNEGVKAGQPLLEFDRISLQSKLQVAQQALATVEADYRQRAQRAVFDAESKSLLAVVQSQLEEKSAEAAYLKSLNERGVVTAPRDGLVLFDDPNQWVGRPVVTGERIMVVADETKVAMEAWLAPADAVSLPDGSDMTLYLASDPLSPLQAHVQYVSHVAQLRPDGQFAYKVRGSLTPQALKAQPRVGMKGTVKLHGETVPLVYRLTRRPWASFRTWVGW